MFANFAEGPSVVGSSKSAREGSSTDYKDEHEAFAASRSTDYVYEVGNDRAFNLLDWHAETVETDAKLPFVITGSPGSGKSALLANWVKRRRQSKHREEFLFQHFVGCSPRSKQLGHLLYRLESALKEHFQLREMEVPLPEERLRWSLNRFLAAAAKKHFPARILIILDAVNRLHGDCSAADTLHWLPTELPQGVRFIVSTVELEDYGLISEELFDEGSRVHRTYTELRRRGCPTMRLQPLTVEVRHQIIGSFLMANHKSLRSLEQAQQFRLVTAKASSQPLFLRTILYALRLHSETSNSPVDDQIDTYLTAETPAQLIGRVLEACSSLVDHFAGCETGNLQGSPGGSVDISVHSLLDGNLPRVITGADLSQTPNDRGANVFSQILTAIFASRHGLSEAEMWGIVEVAAGHPLLCGQRSCIRRLLRDFTFSVKGLRKFSHEDYAAVVYNAYIRTPEIHIRAHQRMARYFSKLSPCHRKLDALPYHLEVSGSWARLRAGLVNVRMFTLWWTPMHKTEFLSLWASLTSCSNKGAPLRKLVTGEFNETMRCDQAPRPCLDVVDEYVHSLNEYKCVQTPADDNLARVIIRVADFLLEFATLRLEEPADVPQFLHPSIPHDDFAVLGVPFVACDKDGNSVLNTPYIESLGEAASGNFNAMDVPMKINEDVPMCSTYFYQRWMWIHFPWVSLANCGEPYVRRYQSARQHHSTLLIPTTMTESLIAQVASPTDHQNSGNLQSLDEREQLPNATRHKDNLPAFANTTRPHDRANAVSSFDARKCNMEQLSRDFVKTVNTLKENVISLRSQLDTLRECRRQRESKYVKERISTCEMTRIQVTSADLELKLSCLAGGVEKAANGHLVARILYRNLERVKSMCTRHPARSAPLLGELELKVRQDTCFIEEVRQRLREAEFCFHDSNASCKTLHRTAQERLVLHNRMLLQRMRQRDTLLTEGTSAHWTKGVQHVDCDRVTTTTVETPIRGDEPNRQLGKAFTQRCPGHARSNENAREVFDKWLIESSNLWEEYADFIRKRTFFEEVTELYSKFSNVRALQNQMKTLHDAAEAKLRELKQCLSDVEAELEQACYNSQSVLGTNSREARELQTRLARQLGCHKHVRESALAAERLRQDVSGGVKHVCNALGIPPPDQDTPVNEIIHQIESVLEALLEEKDKTSQRMCETQSSFRDNTGYEKLTRTPELDAALEQFESPKALIAPHLPARHVDELRRQSDLKNGPWADDGMNDSVLFRISKLLDFCPNSTSFQV